MAVAVVRFLTPATFIPARSPEPRTALGLAAAERAANSGPRDGCERAELVAKALAWGLGASRGLVQATYAARRRSVTRVAFSPQAAVTPPERTLLPGWRSTSRRDDLQQLPARDWLWAWSGRSRPLPVTWVRRSPGLDQAVEAHRVATGSRSVRRRGRRGDLHRVHPRRRLNPGWDEPRARTSVAVEDPGHLDGRSSSAGGPNPVSNSVDDGGLVVDELARTKRPRSSSRRPSGPNRRRAPATGTAAVGRAGERGGDRGRLRLGVPLRQAVRRIAPGPRGGSRRECRIGQQVARPRDQTGLGAAPRHRVHGLFIHSERPRLSYTLAPVRPDSADGVGPNRSRSAPHAWRSMPCRAVRSQRSASTLPTSC